MTARHYSNTTQPTSLTAAVTNSSVTLPVASTAGFPAVPFTIGIDRGTVNEEVCLCTAVTGASMTVTRGYNGTTAVSHLQNVAVEHCVAALDYSEANDHINDVTRDDHTQYQTQARQKLWHPVAYNASAPVSRNPITATTQTVNSITIPSATFSRKLLVMAQVPCGFLASNVLYTTLIRIGAVNYGAGYSYGPVFTNITAISDWITLAAGSAYTITHGIHNDGGSNGQADDDPNLNTMSCLAIANV